MVLFACIPASAVEDPLTRWGPWPQSGEVEAPEPDWHLEEPEAAGPSVVLEAVIRGYQIFLSGSTGGHCNFYPSCSRFGYEAIRRYGIAGLPLIADRLERCQPGAWIGDTYGALVNDRLYDPVELHTPWILWDQVGLRRFDLQAVELEQQGELRRWEGWR